MTEPTTPEGWRQRLDAAKEECRKQEHLLEEARRYLNDSYQAMMAWHETTGGLLAAWEPICARLSAELGTDFAVVDNGGGTHAISAEYGPLLIMITDWQDGDLSHPQAGTGWWVGFTLPDTRWTGKVESIVGDPFARTADDLIKLVAFAVSGYFRGERYPCHAPSEEGMAVIDYDV